MTHAQVEQLISKLETALNDCPQERHSKSIDFNSVFIRFCSIAVFSVFLFVCGAKYVAIYDLKIIPYFISWLILTLCLFGTLFAYYVYSIDKARSATILWRSRVRISVIQLCCWSTMINQEQIDRLENLLTKKKKDLELAFEGCDRPNQQMLKDLLTFITKQ